MGLPGPQSEGLADLELHQVKNQYLYILQSGTPLPSLNPKPVNPKPYPKHHSLASIGCRMAQTIRRATRPNMGALVLSYRLGFGV